MSAAVIVTTTPNIDGKKITSYRGVVTGEAIMGANLFKDLFAASATSSAAARPPTNANSSAPATSPWRS